MRNVRAPAPRGLRRARSIAHRPGVSTELNEGGVSREQILEALAEVVRRQSRVARAEAQLASARSDLDASVARLADLSRERGEGLGLPSLEALAIEAPLPAPRAADPAGTLRARMIALLEASPEEVLTTAQVAAGVGARNRDSVRTTLLALAARGKVEKVGAGQYRARRRR
jgi:hypothetical protein